MPNGKIAESETTRFRLATELRQLRSLTSSGGDLIKNFLLVAALWFGTRPYQGIVHDARLYTVQALAGTQSNDIRSDLFFAFGSQDSFTIFSALYKPLLEMLGVGPGHFLTAMASQAAWTFALVFLLSAVFGRSMVVWASAAVIALSPAYGGLSFFEYGEMFASPRIIAEALIMGAIGLAFRERTELAWVLALCAAAVHPLMSLPGIGVLFVLLARDKLWLWSLPVIGFGVVLGLAAAGVEPFVRAAMRLEGEWLAVVWERCGFAFVTQWTLCDYLDIVGRLSLLGVGILLATEHERRLTGAVLIVGISGLLVSVVGADLANNVLAVNLQLWRSTWLVSLFANAWAAVIYFRLPTSSSARWILLTFMCLTAATRIFTVPDFFSGTIALVSSAVAFAELKPLALRLRPLGEITIKLGLTVVVTVFLVFFFLFMRFRAQAPGFHLIMIAGVACLASLALLALADRKAATFNILPVILLVTTIVTVDRRADWSRFVESGRIPDDLVSFTAESGPSYWERGVELNWFLLRRASYYSCLQGSGVMFYQGTAIEYARRQHRLSALNTSDFKGDSHGMCGPMKESATGPRSIESIGEVCRALPELQTLFLARAIPGTTPRVWRPPSYQIEMQAGQIEYLKSYYRYDCSEYRGLDTRQNGNPL